MVIIAFKRLISTAAALAGLAASLAACDDRPGRWQKSLQAAERADVPAKELAECMTAALRPEASFEIGRLEILEGRELMAGVPTYQVAHGPKTSFPKSSDQVVEEVAEALAVHCRVPREEWRSKPLGVSIDSHTELSTERGVAHMSMAFAHDRFVKHLRSSPEYMDGARIERERKAAATAAASARSASAVAARFQDAHDFAVRK